GAAHAGAGGWDNRRLCRKTTLRCADHANGPQGAATASDPNRLAAVVGDEELTLCARTRTRGEGSACRCRRRRAAGPGGGGRRRCRASRGSGGRRGGGGRSRPGGGRRRGRGGSGRLLLYCRR